MLLNEIKKYTNTRMKNPPGSNFKNILKDPKLFRNIANDINEKKHIIKVK